LLAFWFKVAYNPSRNKAKNMT